MNDIVYKTIEITGTSTQSLEEAIKSGLKRSAETLDGLSWFKVSEIRGSIKDGAVDHYQVTLKIGFALKEIP